MGTTETIWTIEQRVRGVKTPIISDGPRSKFDKERQVMETEKLLLCTSTELELYG